MENVHESRVLIACCQIEPRIGDKEGNLKKTLEFAEKASKEGANIIVLPELANTGYVFNTRGESLDLSEEVLGGDSVRLWEEFAKSRGVYLAAGIAERADDRLYNSSVLIGPGGYIGKYRKLHLWNREKLFFEPGNLGLPVFHTPLGRLAMYICYDMWFPEMTRAYALLGVDLILDPTNWVTPDLERETGLLTKAVCSSQAHLNSVFIAAADRIGTERGQPFIGRCIRYLLREGEDHALLLGRLLTSSYFLESSPLVVKKCHDQACSVSRFFHANMLRGSSVISGLKEA